MANTSRSAISPAGATSRKGDTFFCTLFVVLLGRLPVLIILLLIVSLPPEGVRRSPIVSVLPDLSEGIRSSSCIRTLPVLVSLLLIVSLLPIAQDPRRPGTPVAERRRRR